ncbi:MAG: hypothetical protein IT519_15805 [Burkholderiales bacterium]|nr:hypothetical protein [Burkholderiales bacterium]
MDAVDSPRRYDPLAIGQVVARNIVPVVGILAFGWSAVQVLLLYFIDTMLAMGVMFAGLGSYFARQTAEGGASRINGEAGAIFAAAFICVFIAVPLGMPLVFVGAWSGWEGFAGLWKDNAFLSGAAWQVVAAIGSYLGLWRALKERSPEELRLKRRFALVFLRWIVVILIVYSIGEWFGRFLPIVLVVAYVAASIVVEIAPDHFLRHMPGGADVADPERPQDGPRAPSRIGEGGTASWRRRRRERK